MLESVRKAIGNYILRRETASFVRTLKMVNIEHARRIGIVYQLNGVEDYNHVLEFVTALQHDKKEVKALGFVGEKRLIDRFLPKLAYDFFSSADLNWFYKPVSQRVRDFQNEEFDLLVDLTLQDNLSLTSVVALSVSRCRVGRFSANNAAYYDLMIKTKPLTSLRELITQVKHYLTVIQTPE